MLSSQYKSTPLKCPYRPNIFCRDPREQWSHIGNLQHHGKPTRRDPLPPMRPVYPVSNKPFVLNLKDIDKPHGFCFPNNRACDHQWILQNPLPMRIKVRPLAWVDLGHLIRFTVLLIAKEPTKIVPLDQSQTNCTKPAHAADTAVPVFKLIVGIIVAIALMTSWREVEVRA